MSKLDTYHNDFTVLLAIIRQAKQKAIAQVNTALIELYWEIGKNISQKVAQEKWGKGIVQELATYIKVNEPTSKGFSDKNLWRMKQFYETYKNNEKLSALTREIPWTHNTLIFSRCKTTEEQAFYLNDCIVHKYTSRALDRQITALHYQRTLQNPKLSPMLRESHPKANQLFKDKYTLEFLGLPEPYSEGELQINFYLEALDRDVKKPHENPSIGVLMCSDKDDEVVEYALSRNLSSTLVSQYQLSLPDKKLLESKLQEIIGQFPNTRLNAYE